MLPAPQLVRDSPLTTQEFTWRLPWGPSERASRLQFQSYPPNVSNVLNATPTQDKRIAEAAQSVASALEDDEAWQRLGAATASIDENARTNLREARAVLHGTLAPQAVDQYEPGLAVRRAEYRERALGDAIETLTGAAREYADAFEAANKVVETAASEVFGQLVAFGRPSAQYRASDVDLVHDLSPQLSFILEGHDMPKVGELAWVDNPFSDDAVQIIGLRMTADVERGELIRVSAVLLSGTADTW
jgi:hypothetical protein